MQHHDSAVAFLFADQTGPRSTDGSFTSRSGGMAADVLRILSESVSACGGRELDVTVDSFPAAFPSASAAAACAQMMLERVEETAEAGRAVSLRVGVHAGEPLSIEDGRYFGAAVWTTARLCGRAAAAQILGSSTVAMLLSAAVQPAPVPAGRLRLKGLAEPIEVVDLPWKGSGGRIAPSAARTRRIATVLSVDQVGSTAIIDARGDAGAQVVHAALLDVLREAVEDHGGTESEYGGDGLAVHFDAATDATACAVAMQQAAYRHRRRFPQDALHLRIAITTGEVDEAAPGALDGLISAAGALGRRAEQDAVLLTPLAHEFAAARGTHAFARTDAEPWTLEWKPAQWEFALPASLRDPSFFVGRAEELEVLRRAWTAVQRTGRQRTVLVDGDAGVGKSALAARFAAEAGERHEGVAIFHVRCSTPGGPYEPLVSAFTAFVAASSRADLRRSLGDRAPVLATVMPVIRERLPGLPVLPALLPEAAPYAIGRAFGALLDSVCAPVPGLLVLDDLHDASPELLTVLRSAMSSGAGRALLVLGLGREPESGGSPIGALLGIDERGAEGGALRRTMRGLADEEVAALIGEIAGPVAIDTIRSITAESEGVPYFVIEIVRGRLRASSDLAVRSAAARVETSRAEIRDLQQEVAGAVQRDGDRGYGGTALPIDPDGTPPIAGPNPYRGLLAFGSEDADWFFGRERLTAELVAVVSTSPMVAVVGASGSGKSSLVRAGLLRALADGAVRGSADWPVVVMVPGSSPTDAVLAGVAGAAGVDVEALPATTSGGLPDMIDRIVRRPDAPDRRLLLVVDQAEELFTSTSEVERDRFLDLVADAVDAGAPLKVVLVTRADFYAAWASYPRIAPLLDRNHVLVGAMADAELRRAIEQPAVRADLAVERGLTDAVVADISGEPGALPLLSTALVETWQRRRGASLTLRGYAESGGVRRAIARLGDEVFGALSGSDQRTARRMLLRLARPGEQLDAPDVRRRVHTEELLGVDGGAERVLAQLVGSRLLVRDGSTVEIAHEALLREWPLLRGWLGEDRQGRIVLQRLADDASAWERLGQDPELLYRGSRLAVAASLTEQPDAALTPAERRFLDASSGRATEELTRARRSVRRFRRLTVGLVVGLAVALVAGSFAVLQRREAVDQATAARASSLSAQSATLLAGHEDLAGLLALAAHRLKPSAETARALIEAGNHSPQLLETIRLPEQVGQVRALSADGGSALAVSSAGRVAVADLRSRRVVARIASDRIAGSQELVVSPSGAYVLVRRAHRFVLVQSSTGRTVLDLSATGNAEISGQPTFVGDRIVTFTDPDTNRQRAVDLRTGHDAGLPLPGTTDALTVVASSDGRFLAWCDVDYVYDGDTAARPRTHLVDVGARREVASFDGAVLGLSSTGDRVALMRNDRDVVVLDRRAGRVVGSFAAGGAVTRDTAQSNSGVVRFDRTGGLLAFEGAETGRPLHLIDLRTGVQSTVPVPFDRIGGLDPLLSFADTTLQYAVEGGVLRLRPPLAAPAAEQGTRAARGFPAVGPRAFPAVDPVHGRAVRSEQGPHGALSYVVTSLPDLYDGARLVAPDGGRFDGVDVALSEDGSRVAALIADGRGGASIGLFDAASGRRTALLGPVAQVDPSGYYGAITALRFVQHGAALAFVATPKGLDSDFGLTSSVLHVWDLRHAVDRQTVLGGIAAAAFSPNGRTLATAGIGLRVWDVRGGRARGPAAPSPDPGQEGITSLGFSEDGRWILMPLPSRALRWSTAAPGRPQQITFDRERVYIGSTVVSPDGRSAASLQGDRLVLRGFVGGAPARSLPGPAVLLGWTADSAGVVVSDERAVQVVDVARGTVASLGESLPEAEPDVLADQTEVLAGPRGRVVAQQATGRRLLTQSFDLDLGRLEQRICATAGRELTRGEWERYLPDRPYVALCRGSGGAAS